MKIVFLSRSFSAGGAERQVRTLAVALAARGHDVTLVVFYSSDGGDERLPGVRVVSAGKRDRWDVVGFLVRLVSILREERPDCLHSYLPMANTIAALLRPFLPRTRLVFGLRASNMERDRYGWLERLAYGLERWLARSADLLIANAEVVRQHAIACGYPAERIRLVQNGIDTEVFAPNPAEGQALRAFWQIPEGAFVIGVVGRLDVMKDHVTFLTALAELRHGHGTVRAVLVGNGAANARARLRADAARLGVSDLIVWAGERHDMRAVYSALDLLCLSSAFGEGFPNVVAEAMACAIPCVATNVGDVVEIVGDTGSIVPPGDPEALGLAMAELAEMPRAVRSALGQAARARIVANFGIEKLCNDTLAVLDPLVHGSQ